MAGIDTSIYSQLQPAKVESPLNALAQVMQVQHAQSQNKLADLLFSEKQREVDENANFRNALDGLNLSDTASMQAALPKLLQASPKLGMAFQKQLSDQAKTDAAAQKDRVEALGKAFSIHKDALAGVNDPQSAAAWVKAGYSDPLLGAIAAKTGTLEETLARIPTDSKGFAEWKQRNMLGAEKLMQYLTPDANATLQAQTSRANNADTNAVTMRGQNMTDSRAREANAQGKIPAGYRQTADGNLQAIPGGPADLKLQGAFNQDTASLNASTSAMDRLATAANEALNHPGLAGTAGLRGMIPNRPGSDAANAEALLNTLKSQVAFGVLQDMRNNSKTGGALGSVSDAEGRRLEANLAALDKSQSVEQLQESLKKIIEYTEQAKDRLRGAYNMKHSGQQSGAKPAGGAKPSLNDIFK